MASAAATLRNFVTAKAWRTWGRFCKTRAAKHTRKENALGHHTTRMMTITFCAWQVCYGLPAQRYLLPSYKEHLVLALWLSRVAINTGFIFGNQELDCFWDRLSAESDK